MADHHAVSKLIILQALGKPRILLLAPFLTKEHLRIQKDELDILIELAHNIAV